MELLDGTTLHYDYLIIATGPELAFDEIEGLGPEHNTSSICHVDHALQAKQLSTHWLKMAGLLLSVRFKALRAMDQHMNLHLFWKRN